MVKFSEKLANALEALHQLQERGIIAIRSEQLKRYERERLKKHGFLKEVIKGWYIPSSPEETTGESTSWYTSYWQFIAEYLNELKGNDWCLSPEQSLLIHAGNWAVPSQLVVRSIKARNNKTDFLYGTAILDIRASMPNKNEVVVMNQIRLYSLPAALIACGPRFFTQYPIDARTSLLQIRDSSEILSLLLSGEHTTIAGRLAGAFRNIGQDRIAKEIIKTMQSADYNVVENDPFERKRSQLEYSRVRSPIMQRTQIMWQQMREPIIDIFPDAPGIPKDSKAYLKNIDAIYVNDAYHSLSIEGYRVSPELIERVRRGKWEPNKSKEDKEQVNAMAARGYWQAYQLVHRSIEKILQGGNPGEIVDNEHVDWYRELFSPSIMAGILEPKELAGYRNAPVYIRNSMHVPPNPDAVRDAMPAYFDCLSQEEEPSVRVVLGYFLFVYIHPYMDGNGRMGRFLMNAMMAGAGFPWTIIPLEKRAEYMATLEEASVKQNIEPFAIFLKDILNTGYRYDNE